MRTFGRAAAGPAHTCGLSTRLRAVAVRAWMAVLENVPGAAGTTGSNCGADAARERAVQRCGRRAAQCPRSRVGDSEARVGGAAKKAALSVRLARIGGFDGEPRTALKACAAR